MFGDTQGMPPMARTADNRLHMDIATYRPNWARGQYSEKVEVAVFAVLFLHAAIVYIGFLSLKEFPIGSFHSCYYSIQ